MRRRYGWAVLIGLMAACDATGGGGCGGCAGAGVSSYPEPPPPGGEILSGVVRAHLTEGVLGFLRAQVPPLITAFLTVEDGKAVYYLDESVLAMDGFLLRDGCIGAIDPCPARAPGSAEEIGPTHASRVYLDMTALEDSLTVSWIEADATGLPGVRIAINDLDLYADLALVAAIQSEMLSFTAACRLQGAGGAPLFTIPQISFEVRLGIDDSGPLPVLTSRVPEPVIDLGDLASLELPIAFSPCDGSVDECADPRCVGAWGTFPEPDCTNMCTLLNLFGADYGSFIVGMIEPMLADLGPVLTTSLTEALDGALASVPPLTFETELDVGALAGDVLAHAEPLSVKVVASSDFDIRGTGPARGLDAGVDGGVATAVPARCAERAEPPDLSALIGPPPVYSGFIEVLDDTGAPHFEAYHVALAASEAMLNQVSWSAFQSGILCFSLDSWDIERLTGGALGISAGLLMGFDSHLSGLADEDAPLRFDIAAAKEPAVRLGAGTVIADGVEDPLIELVVDDLAIDIDVLIDGSYSRLAGLTADLVVRLGLERTPEQGLELVLQELGVFDVQQTYNELAPGADFARLFEIVIDLALDQLLGGDMRFAVANAVQSLGEMMGIELYLRLNALRRDLGPTSARFLSVYATLCDGLQITDPASTACYSPGFTGGRSPVRTSARLLDEESLYIPPDPARFPPEQWAGVPSGRALLEVGAGPLDGTVYLYQFRVDEGLWSSFRPATGGLLEMTSPRLYVVGRHVIEVRARPLADYQQLSPAVRVPVMVDRERPRVILARSGDEVRVEAFDLGSPDALELWARFGDDEEWRRTGAVISVAGLTGELQVMARDLAGNSSTASSLSLGPAPAVAHLDGAGESAAASGCSATPPPLIGAALLLGFGWLGRRRRGAR